MNFTPIAGCVDCCLRFILLLFAVFILVRDYFLMVYEIVIVLSRKGVVRHIDVVRRQDITNIFLCKVIHFFNKQQSFYGKIIKKTKFCANKYKKCIIYRYYSD